MAEILEQIERMSYEELRALLAAIQLRLEQAEVPLALGEREELARRIALADANPLEGSSWAEVRARLTSPTAREAEKVAA